VLARYRAELGSAVTREVEGDEESRVWRAIADFPLHRLTENDLQGILRFPALLPILSINIPPADVSSTIQQLQQFITEDEVSVTMVGRVGIGHLLLAFGRTTPNFRSSLTTPSSTNFALRFQVMQVCSCAAAWRTLVVCGQ